MKMSQRNHTGVCFCAPFFSPLRTERRPSILSPQKTNSVHLVAKAIFCPLLIQSSWGKSPQGDRLKQQHRVS